MYVPCPICVKQARHLLTVRMTSVYSFHMRLGTIATLMMLMACGSVQTIRASGTNGGTGGSSGGGETAGATDGGTTADNNEPPSVTIAFPPTGTLTDATSIAVRGTVTDDKAGASVVVNGVEAVVTDDSFTADVPLQLGNNSLSVTVTDSDGESAAPEITNVRRDPVVIHQFSGLALDQAGNRLFAGATRTSQVVVINLATNEMSVLSGGGVGTGPTFGTITALTYANSRLFVGCGNGSVFQVDPSNGNRTLLSNDSNNGYIMSMAYAPLASQANPQLFLVNASNTNTVRTLTLGASVSATTVTITQGASDVPGLVALRSVAYATNTNQLFVGGLYGTVWRVALNVPIGTGPVVSGTANILTGFNDQSQDICQSSCPEMPGAMSLAIENNNTLLMMGDDGSMQRLQRTSEERNEILAPSALPLEGNASHANYDATNDRLIFIAGGGHAISAAGTGSNSTRVGLFHQRRGSGPVLDRGHGAAFDAASNRYFTGTAENVWSVDASSGGRVQLASSSLHLAYPYGMALVGSDLYVINQGGSGNASLTRVTLSSGATSVTSRVGTDGSGHDLDGVTAVDRGLDDSHVFITQMNYEAPDTFPELLKVNLADGVRTLVWSPTESLVSLKSLVVDRSSGHAYVSDVNSSRIFKVNLNQQPVTSVILASASVGAGDAINSPNALALDSTGRLIVSCLGGLYVVDKTTGNRTLFSAPNRNLGTTTLLFGELVAGPGSLIIGRQQYSGHLVGVDLVSGHHVVVAR